MDKVILTKTERGAWEAFVDGKLTPKDLSLLKRALTVGYRRYLRGEILKNKKAKEKVNG